MNGPCGDTDFETIVTVTGAAMLGNERSRTSQT